MPLLTRPVSLQVNNFFAQLEDLKLADQDIYDRIPWFVPYAVIGSILIFSLFTLPQWWYQWAPPKLYWCAASRPCPRTRLSNQPHSNLPSRPQENGDHLLSALPDKQGLSGWAVVRQRRDGGLLQRGAGARPEHDGHGLGKGPGGGAVVLDKGVLSSD